MGGPHGEPVAVLGAGAWGTALAIQFARAGRTALLWGHDEAHVRDLVTGRENARRLPGIELPEEVVPQSSLESALAGSRDVLVVVPSHALREVFERIHPLLGDGTRIAWATKGFEHGTGRLPHELADEILGRDRPKAVLSGPTFAKEVAEGLPSALTIAATDQAFGEGLAESLHTREFRAYLSEDLIGVEVGGAVKNVLAIGAGISDGLGYGANTRTALITRGLAEMMRLTDALGGDRMTLTGLAGIGDLILTCTDDQSRNRRCGLALAAGASLEDARDEIGLIEGADAAVEARRAARAKGVEMPLTEHVHAILYEGLDPREATEQLMLRELRPELD